MITRRMSENVVLSLEAPVTAAALYAGLADMPSYVTFLRTEHNGPLIEFHFTNNRTTKESTP